MKLFNFLLKLDQRDFRRSFTDHVHFLLCLIMLSIELRYFVHFPLMRIMIFPDDDLVFINCLFLLLLFFI